MNNSAGSDSDPRKWRRKIHQQSLPQPKHQHKLNASQNNQPLVSLPSIQPTNMQNKPNKSSARTCPAVYYFLAAITSACLQPISSALPTHANPSESRRRPINIDVKKVKITDEDVDIAIKLCLAKERTFDQKPIKAKKPTAAQAFVMATICE